MGVFTGGGNKKGSGIVFGSAGASEKDRLERSISNYENRFSTVGESPPEPEKESNLLLKALDVLDTPRRELLKGLTGKEHVAELLEGIENPYLRAGAGFVGDVLTDPLTYLTLGTAGVAKGAATQGARTMLKFAGQPLADVTPITSAIGRGVQATRIPELLGPVFNPKHISRAVTSADELPDIEAARDLFRDTQRLIKGQQQEALDDLTGTYRGMTPEAAQQAAHIIEAPTQLSIKQARDAVKVKRPRVTVRRSGQAAPLGNMLSRLSLIPATPGEVPIEQALSVPTPGSMAGINQAKRVPGLGIRPGEAFQIKPRQAVQQGASGSPAVGVRTPQGAMEPLIHAVKRGVLDRKTLNSELAKMNPAEQKQLLDSIAKAIQDRLPANVRAELKRVQVPRVAFKGQKFTERDLLEYRKQIEKSIEDLNVSMAKYMRDTAKEAAKEGDIYRQIRDRGGIRQTDFYKTEYLKNIPLGLRNKSGASIDEMADELGMSADELLQALTGRKPLTGHKTADFLNDAERLLADDPEYQTKLRAVAKIEELISKLAPEKIPPEIRALLPKITKAEDVLNPEVKAAVERFIASPEAKSLLEKLKGMENISAVRPVKMAGEAVPKAKDLSLPVDQRVQVAFEKMPLPPGIKQNVFTLLRQAKNGAQAVDRQLLNDTLQKLPQGAQKDLFDAVRYAIEQKRMPTKTTRANIVREGSRLAKVKSVKSATDEEMINAARELGFKLTPEGIAAARVAKRISEQTAKRDVAADVAFTELPNYIRHLYKDDWKTVKKVFDAWAKKYANLPGKLAGFQKERKFPTLIEAKRFAIEELGIELHPIEDVRVLTAVREMEGIQQRAINGMYQRLSVLGSNVVRDIKQAPQGWKQLPIKQLEGKAVHPEVARFIERFNSTINTDQGIKSMLSALSGVQNFWKGLVTAPNPAFHVRNAMSNVFNNFLAGVVNPDVYRLAVVAQSGGSEVLKVGGKDITAKELRRIFREKGLEGFGFFAGEYPKSMLREATGRFEKRPLRERISLIQKGRKAGDWLETNAKMAHFIDRLNKGDAPEEAAKSVRKYLFDYGDLTDAEKKIRDFVPFYTFTRKNLPLQIENLITNPGKMTALYKLAENAQEAHGVKDDDTPEWMKSELAVALGDNKHLMLDLPLIQLNLLGDKSLRNALGMITPLAKVPIELAMGKQIFSGADIEKYPGATARFGNLELPAKAAYGLSQLGPMPRTAADIAGALVDQQPREGKIAPAPKQMPLVGSFVRKVDPEREKILGLYRRERQLADYRRYLAEAKGIDIPTMTELKKGKGRVFG
jgi:hypothetical protein